MSFLTPFFFLGAAAVAAPILVHLVRRTRARRIQFPALLFVRQVPQRTIRRRTLQNLLLLVLRCLAILLIVIAFTRPFFTTRAARNASGAGATVILLDNSLSMRREQLFANAQSRAEAAVNDAASNEQLAVVTYGNRYNLVNRFTNDRNRLLTTIRSSSPGWEGTNYEQALRGAESLLTELRPNGPKRIVMISDFQASGWNQANATFKLASDTQLTTLDVGDPNPPANVAVTNLEARGVVFNQKYSDNLAVQISNFSDTARDHVEVTFQLNDQTVEKRDIHLDSNDNKVVEFSNFNLNEGANRATIEIASNDFAHDNRFYFTLRREVPNKALIIESGARGANDTVHLQSALTTNDDLPFNFTVKTTGSVDPAAIAENSLVILNDSGPLPNAVADTIVRFVKAGGQLIVSTGPRTDASTFNKSLESITPAELKEAVQTKPGESTSITSVKFDHPIFEIFQQSGRLASAQVIGYYRSEPRNNASVLARFEDGSPALLESLPDKGRVLMFTTSLGPSWNDLPLTPIYLPFIHQMIRYAGSRDDSAWYGLGQTFTVRKEAEGIPAVDSPGGNRLGETRLTAAGDLLVTANEPGFYRVRYPGHPDFAAVDTDGTEGDFRKLDFGQFVSAVTGGAGNAEGSVANSAITGEETEGRQHIWWSLLLIALLLLVAESIVARRTKVARMVG
ncbi:MAG TPA: VWA domain-containing protein [Pyrinomonadaceae bacterium]|nr:VWA domain-containing protein [Pyrinomonadaceae bacterium]